MRSCAMMPTCLSASSSLGRSGAAMRVSVEKGQESLSTSMRTLSPGTKRCRNSPVLVIKRSINLWGTVCTERIRIRATSTIVSGSENDGDSMSLLVHSIHLKLILGHVLHMIELSRGSGSPRVTPGDATFTRIMRIISNCPSDETRTRRFGDGRGKTPPKVVQFKIGA